MHDATDLDTRIEALHVDQIAEASRLLARAFEHDTIITHYLDDPIRRAVVFPAFFAAALEGLFASNTVFVARAGTRLLGVAAWLPPNPAEPDDASRARAQHARRLVETMFPRTAGTLFDGMATLKHLHPTEPHWYLGFIGVEEEFRGRGIGRTLLAPVLSLADETGTICYLETPFPATHPFYRSLGFVHLAQHDVFPGAPEPLDTFLRQPRG